MRGRHERLATQDHQSRSQPREVRRPSVVSLSLVLADRIRALHEVVGVMKVLGLVLLLGCGTAFPKQPIKVELTKPLRTSCWMDDPPEPPLELNLNMTEEDIIRRVFIHKLEYNEAVVWMRAATAWMADLKVCLRDQ